MAQIKLTKTELREQQIKFAQLQKYLPTLQLKKALLQVEVNQALQEEEELNHVLTREQSLVQQCVALFSEKNTGSFLSSLVVQEVKVKLENIAGVDVPVFEKIIFPESTYTLFDTPIWYESVRERVQKMLEYKERIKIVILRRVALEREHREVSIRVNLFEKILIPRAIENIKRIKIFLSDQQLAAISQAKVAKKKILEQEEER